MFKLVAVLFALLVVSPAYAMNELLGPLSKIEEMAQKHGVVIEKLNDADTAAMDAKTEPRPKPSSIYLLTLGSSVIIALVHEETVIFSSNPVELETVNKVLNRSGA